MGHSYLSKFGYEPAKVRKNDYWYLSPLRNENTPSFKIDRSINRWYDHGIGKGGNLVDFGILYFGCSVAELLEKLGGDFSFQQPIIARPLVAKKQSKITILGTAEINSYILLNYLRQRKIDINIAVEYCREIHFKMDDKTYFAIGFKNDSGGYELRNRYFKSSSFPKDITTIRNGLNNLHVSVFEGFFDFLSYLTSFRFLGTKGCDFVILNSLSLFEKGRPFLEQHNRASLYLDNDAAGQNCSSLALSLSDIYKDESSLYKGYKDVNEWLVNK